MKVGDLVKQVSWDGYGIVTQINCDREIVFIHFRDKAHWIVASLVERINESR